MGEQNDIKILINYEWLSDNNDNELQNARRALRNFYKNKKLQQYQVGFPNLMFKMEKNIQLKILNQMMNGPAIAQMALMMTML